jgi:hypothetical protein
MHLPNLSPHYKTVQYMPLFNLQYHYNINYVYATPRSITSL